MDDNPTERELVRQMLPDGGGSRVSKTALYATRFLDHLVGSLFPCLFGDGGGSAEDRAVQGECEPYTRAKEICGFRSVSTESEIEMRIEPISSFNVSRIAQMTHKTNQFNLTTRRYSESDPRIFLRGLVDLLSFRQDRFGDNGITGAVLLRPVDGGYEIDSFLLSCRILGKGIEEAYPVFLIY